MTIYTVTFDSGAFSYSDSDNVIESINVYHTKSENYQTSDVVLYGIPNLFEIGMDININVNGEDIFSGFISEIKITSKGTRRIHLVLIGKTFNLWKDIIS